MPQLVVATGIVAKLLFEARHLRSDDGVRAVRGIGQFRHPDRSSEHVISVKSFGRHHGKCIGCRPMSLSFGD